MNCHNGNYRLIEFPLVIRKVLVSYISESVGNVDTRHEISNLKRQGSWQQLVRDKTILCNNHSLCKVS